MVNMSNKLPNNSTTQGRMTTDNWNNRAKEEENLVTVMGVALDENSELQMLEGVDYVAKMQIYKDTGSSVNVYECPNRSGVNVETPNLKIDMGIKIIIGNTSTGASTLNYAGFGAKSIRNTDNSHIKAGELESGKMYEFVYDGNYWILQGKAGDKVLYSGNSTPNNSINPAGTGAIYTDTQAEKSYVCVDNSTNNNRWKAITDVRIYDALVEYDLNEKVLSNDGVFFQSLTAMNSGNPLTSFTHWRQLTTAPLLTNRTINVPSDIATVQLAIAYITRCFYPTTSNIFYTINLDSGYQMNEQVFARGVNLGWIRITGTDGSTTTNANTYNLQDYVYGMRPLFCAVDGGILPMIDQTFSMLNANHTNGNHGVLCYRGGKAIILPNRGVTNADTGYYAFNGGEIIAPNTTVDNAITDGLYAGYGSKIVFGSGSAVNCGNKAVFCTDSSIVDCYGAILTGASVNGISCVSSGKVSAINANFRIGGSDSSSDCVVQNGGIVGVNGGVGGINIAPNTTTANGIIFQ